MNNKLKAGILAALFVVAILTGVYYILLYPMFLGTVSLALAAITLGIIAYKYFLIIFNNK